MSVSVAIITRGESDLSRLLQRCDGVSTVVFAPHALGPHSLDTFDCASFLAARMRSRWYCPPEPQRIGRPSRGQKGVLRICAQLCAELLHAARIHAVPAPCVCGRRIHRHAEGTLLDEQCNFRSAPYYKCRGARPVLVYKKGLTQHACEPLSESDKEDHTAYGVWFETPTTAVCSFRLCNFVRARFAPVSVWRRVVAALVEWLCGTPVELPPAEPAYTLGRSSELGACAQAALHWFEASGTPDGETAACWRALAPRFIRTAIRKSRFHPYGLLRRSGDGLFFHALLRVTQRAGHVPPAGAYAHDVRSRPGRCAGMLRWTDVAGSMLSGRYGPGHAGNAAQGAVWAGT
ncbi:MAG: hypothetical protein ACLSBB_14390 [Ruthenibacterium lactatiformans]